jgi:hypothetical protein
MLASGIFIEGVIKYDLVLTIHLDYLQAEGKHDNTPLHQKFCTKQTLVFHDD